MGTKSNLLVFVDIDGTISFVGDRFTSNPPPRNKKRLSDEYEKWLDEVQTSELFEKDRPVAGMQKFCEQLDRMFYLTSRHEKYLKDTVKWLRVHHFPPKPLLMRHKTNTQPYHLFKRDVIKNAIISIAKEDASTPEAYNVVVIDDDPKKKLIKICKKEGWTFLKAFSGGKVL